MTNLVRENLGAIITVMLEISLMLAIALSANANKKRMIRALQAGAQALKFPYPPVLRWLMGIGAVALLLSATLSAILPPHIPAWIPIMFLAFGIGCAYAWYYLSGEVIIDIRGVTLVKFGGKTRIDYPELKYVTDHRAGNYIVLHGLSKRIRIEYQLQEFETFLDVLGSAFRNSRGIELPFDKQSRN